MKPLFHPTTSDKWGEACTNLYGIGPKVIRKYLQEILM